MNFSITRPDPFGILASTKSVMEHAKFVSVDQAVVQENANKVGEYLKERMEFPDHKHRLTGDFETDAQMTFFETMVAFCFWALPGKPKWAIKMPDGEKVDGWYGVAAAFQRAYDEGVPVTDANFFAKATKEDIGNIFRSATAAEIPLLNERVAILNQNGRILQERFKGKVSNLLEAANRDVVQLFQLLLEHFPAYRDVTTYNDREVVFLKILHLLALDLEYRLVAWEQRPFLKNFDQLCVFADYKLPQLLRAFGVLEYTKELADLVYCYREGKRVRGGNAGWRYLGHGTFTPETFRIFFNPSWPRYLAYEPGSRTARRNKAVSSHVHHVLLITSNKSYAIH